MKNLTRLTYNRYVSVAITVNTKLFFVKSCSSSKTSFIILNYRLTRVLNFDQSEIAWLACVSRMWKYTGTRGSRGSLASPVAPNLHATIDSSFMYHFTSMRQTVNCAVVFLFIYANLAHRRDDLCLLLIETLILRAELSFHSNVVHDVLNEVTRYER